MSFELKNRPWAVRKFSRPVPSFELGCTPVGIQFRVARFHIAWAIIVYLHYLISCRLYLESVTICNGYFFSQVSVVFLRTIRMLICSSFVISDLLLA